MPNLSKLLKLFCVFLFLSGKLCCQINYFKTDKDTITPLGSTILHWSVKGPDSIFITGIGRVKSTGEKKITLNYSKEFLIMLQTDTSAYFKSIKIEVGGKKGFGDFPDETNFEYRNTLEVATTSISIDLLINKICQTFENYGCKINTINKIGTDGEIEIVTNYSANQNLIAANSTQTRKVAFILEIKRFEIINNKIDLGSISFKIPSTLNISIKPLIQFNLLGEPNKVTILEYQRNQNAYFQAALNLKNKIIDLTKTSLKK